MISLAMLSRLCLWLLCENENDTSRIATSFWRNRIRMCTVQINTEKKTQLLGLVELRKKKKKLERKWKRELEREFVSPVHQTVISLSFQTFLFLQTATLCDTSKIYVVLLLLCPSSSVFSIQCSSGYFFASISAGQRKTVSYKPVRFGAGAASDSGSTSKGNVISSSASSSHANGHHVNTSSSTSFSQVRQADMAFSTFWNWNPAVNAVCALEETEIRRNEQRFAQFLQGLSETTWIGNFS